MLPSVGLQSCVGDSINVYSIEMIDRHTDA